MRFIKKEKRGEDRSENRLEKSEEDSSENELARSGGKAAARRQTVVSMAMEGLPVELIARIVKESTDRVRQWIDEGTAAAR